MHIIIHEMVLPEEMLPHYQVNNLIQEILLKFYVSLISC